MIENTVLGANPRKLRCKACRHEWIYEPIASVLPPLPSATLEQALHTTSGFTADQETSSNKDIFSFIAKLQTQFPLGWLFFFFVVMGSFSSLSIARESIVARWPTLGNLYQSFGLTVAAHHYGLKLDHTEATYVIEDGKPVLVIKGEIINRSNQVQHMPPLKVSLRGKSDELGSLAKLWYRTTGRLQDNSAYIITTWTHPFSETRILPGERIFFETSPPAGVPENAIQIFIEF